MSALVQEMRDTGVGAGGSNVIPDNPTLGQQVVDGAFGADFRQEVPIAYGVEAGELGDFTPAQIGAYAYDALHANYKLGLGGVVMKSRTTAFEPVVASYAGDEYHAWHLTTYVSTEDVVTLVP